MQNNPWHMASGKPFPEIDLKKYYGFVYRITCLTTGKKYLGKKTFWFRRKTKVQGKTKMIMKFVTKESDWKTYFGSSKAFKDMVKLYGQDKFLKEILSIHLTKGDCNYTEVKEQFLRNVLEDDDYINENISGKYYRGRVNGIERIT